VLNPAILISSINISHFGLTITIFLATRCWCPLLKCYRNLTSNSDLSTSKPTTAWRNYFVSFRIQRRGKAGGLGYR